MDLLRQIGRYSGCSTRANELSSGVEKSARRKVRREELLTNSLRGSDSPMAKARTTSEYEHEVRNKTPTARGVEGRSPLAPAFVFLSTPHCQSLGSLFLVLKRNVETCRPEVVARIAKIAKIRLCPS